MPDVDPDQQLEFDLSDQAQEFSAEIHKAAREAENEEELRIKMSRVIEGVIESLDIDSSGTHERTILSGRPDSVYGDLVIEYKAPNRTDNWRNEVIYGRGTDDHGLVDYLLGLASEQAEGTEEQLAILNRTVGVGTNGYKVFFCRYKPESSLEVDSGESLDRQAVAEGISATKTFSIADGARRLLTFLRSLQRRPLTSDTLAESFGPEGEIARETVRLFYQLLQEGRENSPRVEMLYEEWNRVFGVVYGEELDQIRDDREEFGAVYGIEDPEVRPLLFSVHSYYAILMKVIVRELVAYP